MRGELKSRARTNKRSAKDPPAQLSEGMEMEQLLVAPLRQNLGAWLRGRLRNNIAKSAGAGYKAARD